MLQKLIAKSAFAAVVWLCGLVNFNADADPLLHSSIVPFLGAQGQRGYLEFKMAPSHRAFAIAAGGAWAWVSGHASTSEAAAGAMEECKKYSDQKCMPYAINDQIVLDKATLAASWSPYLSANKAAAANEGVMRGNRFPDLELNAPDGTQMSLSTLKRHVVFLHFWGSWCPPCQIEFPELQKLYDVFSNSPDIDFVLVQTREPITKSRQWANRRGITMPLYDSGANDRRDTDFSLAGGLKIGDRRLAPVFPSTYVLDSNGIVVFAHAGPIADWPGYEPLLRHVINAVNSK
ncbi:MAG: TlpA family protein disulfide reductase [Nitrospinaceae bacterium]|nr:TlpA family protein disulfide reductase [Nitrospinaceae bacterium]